MSDKDILNLLKANKEYNNSELEPKPKEVKEKVLAKPGEVIMVDERAEFPPSLWQKIVDRLRGK